MKQQLMNNFTKGTIIQNLPYAASFIFLCLAISEANFKSLGVSCMIGLIFGVACILLDVYRNVISKLKSLEKTVCAVISVFIAVLLSFEFYSTWYPSSKIRSLLGLISGNTDLLLRIGSVVFVLLGYAAIFIVVSLFVRFLLAIICPIDFKQLWNNLVSNCSIKCIVLSIIDIVAAALVGTVLLTAVYSIPLTKIEKNVGESAFLIQDEGTYPSVFEWCHSSLDNFTDAIMLLEASNQIDSSSLDKAMQAYRGSIDGLEDPYEVLVQHFTKGESFTQDVTYIRYWHGYQILLKPLLSLMNYVDIRLLNGIVQILLFILICFLLYKKGKVKYILPYAITYLLLMPVVLAESFQFSSCYYIFSLGTIILLLLKDSQREKFYWLVFLNIGVSVAFFDFLTYPIATFGIPAIIFVSLEKIESLELLISKIIKAGLAWCVGYIGMWSMKWAISSIVTKSNIFANAFSAIQNRTSHSSGDGKEYYSVFSCIIKNFKAFNNTPFLICLIFLLIFTVYKVYHSDLLIDFSKIKKKTTVWFLIAVLPILWYIFATNHSSIHYWFTNKALSVSALAVGFICVSIIESNEKASDLKKEDNFRGRLWIK